MSSIEFYLVSLGVFAAINGIQVLGLNLQYGVTGILNFGFILLVAVGAYATGIAAMPPARGLLHYVGGFNWPFPWDLLFGVGVTVIFGLMLAVICFQRVAHWYLAITLSAISYGALLFVSNYTQLLNGYYGLYGVPGPWQVQLTPEQFQIVCLLIAVSCLAVVAVVFWRIERAPLGRTLRAIRDDETAAMSLAKNSLLLKTLAFLLGSAAAGLGGGLTILYLGSWDPSAWLPGETLVLFAAVIIGGRGWTVGAFVGSVVIYDVLIEAGRFIPVIGDRPDLLPTIQGIALGVGLLAVLYWRPEGALPEPKQFFRKLNASISPSSAAQSSIADIDIESGSQ